MNEYSDKNKILRKLDLVSINFKCRECDTKCLMDFYTEEFVCQKCGTRYILRR